MIRMIYMAIVNAQRSSQSMLTGIVFICIAFLSYALWLIWLSTRVNRPVYIPISMVVGHVRTPEFKVNRAALYDIEIEVQKTIPFERLNCLLGTAMAERSTVLQDCPDNPSVVKASWILSSGGRLVAKGSSDTPRSGSWGNYSISRQLGSFQSQKGRPYVLDVEVLADGSSLASGNPRLRVEVFPSVYEDDVVYSAELSLLAGLLILVGIWNLWPRRQPNVK
jgi:hypothetical protein